MYDEYSSLLALDEEWHGGTVASEAKKYLTLWTLLCNEYRRNKKT